MKIKTKGSVLLWLAWMLCIWSLVLNVTDWAEEGKALKMDLQYAVQHINTVKLISDLPTNTNTATIGTVGNGLVWIKTENFVISKVWDDEENQINNSKKSNILWWIKNRISEWQYSSILWWEHNVISNWKYSTILWWKDNNIQNDSSYSTILWWQSNYLTWNGSVIAGWYGNHIKWNYSVTVWNNNIVNWNNSVALWTNSIVEADNSFLWTDNKEAHNVTLGADNVFAVVSDHGMVVNAPQAHTLAQLTIWWPLIIDEWKAPQCKDWYNSWVMKVVDRGDDDLKCLCGCDGYAWHSLYGQWKCEAQCNNSDRPEWQELKPECAQNGEDNDLVYRCSDGSKNYFNGKCAVWNVVQWTWAYLVTKDNMVHWACQTDDGYVDMCAGVAEQWTSEQCE